MNWISAHTKDILQMCMPTGLWLYYYYLKLVSFDKSASRNSSQNNVFKHTIAF